MSLRSKLPYLSVLMMVLVPAAASAHVVVTPKQVGVAAFQTFDISVPNEKGVPVTGLRLVIPAGLGEVSPTVKNGWQITTKRTGEGDDATVTEIDWTGGGIPADLRDDFTFSAQAPAKATTLAWKAYQTYADGTTVSWDATPGGDDDATGDKGPYSTTMVVNDLATTDSSSSSSDTGLIGVYVLSGLGLVIGFLALVRKR